MRNTTLCHLERDGKYLMLHRVKKAVDENQDKWIGPGGKPEPGVRPEECAVREVQEETGLTMTDYEYQGIVTFVSSKWGTEYMHLFWSDSFQGTLKECDEGVLEWIGKEDLLTKNIWEGDKIFLRLLDEKVPFFSLKLVYDDEDKLLQAILNGRKKLV